ncbi:MAG: IS607 family transposase [Candidatus Hydrothermarchaeota archaeon]
MEKHYRPKEAAEILGLTTRHLRKLENEGKIRCIRTPGGRRRFPQSELERVLGISRPKVLVVYGRVSSHEQKKKGDLSRQVEYVKEKMNTQEWEEVRVVTDIGSGLNADRIGLKKILSWAKEREISDIAVATEDRLTRFGMEYIKWILERDGVVLHIVDVLEDQSVEEELQNDMIALVSSFAGKLYGLSSHKRQRLVEKVKEELEEE